MRYRERVTIQEPTTTRSPTGVTSSTWAAVAELDDLPATIVPSTTESRASEMTSELDRYDIVLAGRHPEIRTTMAVEARGRRYEIEAVDLLLGERQTWLRARLVTEPAPADEEGS